jgi:TRAP-type mannitol/chloroaromatic compound transport system permease large subunit
LSAFAPWAVTPILMLGGAYLCFEATEKIIEAVMKTASHEDKTLHVEELAQSSAEVEAQKVAGAIRTDFILSGEIMAIALATVADRPFAIQAGALVLVAMERKSAPAWFRGTILAVLPAAFMLVLVRALGGASTSPLLMVAGLAALIVLLAGVALAAWQELRKGVLVEVAASTATMVSMLTLIVLGATMLSLVFRGLGGDDLVHDALTSLPGGMITAVLVVMVVIFILGFLLEYIEIIFIVVPVAAPPLMAAGVDPVWFAILISMNLQMSFLTPPFGYALFYFRSVAPAELATRDIYASVAPFILLQLLALALVAAFPALATWLPGVIFR